MSVPPAATVRFFTSVTSTICAACVASLTYVFASLAPKVIVVPAIAVMRANSYWPTEPVAPWLWWSSTSWPIARPIAFATVAVVAPIVADVSTTAVTFAVVVAVTSRSVVPVP